MTPRFRFAPHGLGRLHELERLLNEAYGAPESLLGNHANPLDEAVYIILSFQTDLARFKETWQKLRSTFPRWSDVEQATLNELSAVLRRGGLHRQKARTIKRLLRAVRRQFGDLSLGALHPMGDVEAERGLTRLPGMSWKGARCVLLYSLDREVFPIDGNSFRVLRRAGVIPLSAVYRRLSLHDAIQDAIAPKLRRPLHVNLVVHGQETCLPQRPRCEACPAASLCRRRGLSSRLPDPGRSRVAVAAITLSSRRQVPIRSGESIYRTSPPRHAAVRG
jgi:endonuclease III